MPGLTADIPLRQAVTPRAGADAEYGVALLHAGLAVVTDAHVSE
jgi:hypothetical protein